jgi:hypothetical protein
MEVKGELHGPDLSPLQRNAGVYLTGGCFGHRAGLDVFEGRIISRSYRDPKLLCPASGLVTITTMLFWFLVVLMRNHKIEEKDYRLLHISLSAYLSACNNRLPLYIFLLNLIFEDFLKSCRKIQASLKSDKNHGCFIWRLLYIYDHTSLIS